MHEVIGILLINLGTPNAPTRKSVRKYLREFLFDPRVIELPTVLRWLLLNCIILPFRTKKSTHAYKSIWQPNGSPLLTNSILLKTSIQNVLGDKFKVALGMTYGDPSIASAIQELQSANVQKIIVLPLFPQYSSAANGAAIQKALQIIAREKVIQSVYVINQFYNDPNYIQAMAESIQPYLTQSYDYLLMSYHGLPERQLINPGINCYRTQCEKTSQLIANKLQLERNKWGISFQSRLGRLPWIKPYTEDILNELYRQGCKRVLIVCPSFVVDCLETLEEIKIRAKEQWLELGGESLELIPCLNAQDFWVAGLSNLLVKLT